MIHEKALFIGPYGENSDLFTAMVQTLLNDVIQWRRNFHPSDSRLITGADKRTPAFMASVENLRDRLDTLLGEMKKSVPFHSPRMFGHMHADLAMPAILGYFTGLLYNQNNVVGESSPVTIIKEMDFVRELCKMVGYKPFDLHEGAWGHLASGGTTANLEAMWIARNIKYYPVSLKLLIERNPKYSFLEGITVVLPNKEARTIANLGCVDLFNISTESVLLLKDACNREVGARSTGDAKSERARFSSDIESFFVQHLGVAGIMQAAQEIGQAIPLPTLFVGVTGHYSWEKNMDILGIGRGNVVRISVDNKFRIDDIRLKDKIDKADAVLMVIGVAGTTEEGAIDPIHMLKNVQKQWEEDSNKSFYLHVDAAYGGYFASLGRDGEDNEAFDVEFSDVQPQLSYIKESLRDLPCADSIVIDPHKLGYVPYSAGAVLFKDTRMKEFIYVRAPYLQEGSEENRMESTYFGGWTLEGSRSGASALACYLASQTISLNRSGYGYLLAKTISFTRQLYNEFELFNSFEGNEFKIVPVYEPDTNILCYFIAAPQYLNAPKYLNVLTLAAFEQMTVSFKQVLPSYEYIASKTELSYKTYPIQIMSILQKAGYEFDTLADDFELVLLRTVVMNPMLENITEQLYKAYINKLADYAKEALPRVLLDTILNERKGERVKILWVENQETFKSIKSKMEMDAIASIPAIGKYLDISFYNFSEGIDWVKSHLSSQKSELYLIDLNLNDTNHDGEFESGKSVVDLIEERDHGKVILYSTYFSDYKYSEQMKNFFKMNYNFKDYQFLEKTNDRNADMEKLIKKLFYLL